MSESLVPSLVRFMRSIAVLALPAEGQVQWLNSLGLPGRAYVADELGLEFDDGFLLVPQFVERGWISAVAANGLRELDDLLRTMSGQENADVWKVSALGHAGEWATVRSAAARVLQLF